MKNLKSTHPNGAFAENSVLVQTKPVGLRKLVLLTALLFSMGKTFAQSPSPYITGKQLGSVQNSFPSNKWKELILNSDGSINWSQYGSVARNFNKPEIIDYRFGPKYSHFHSSPENFPTVEQTGSGGWDPAPWNYTSPKQTDWSQMSGQLLYSPDGSDDPGMARARSCALFCTDGNPGVISDMRISWTPDPAHHWMESQDGATRTPSWISASGGKLPTPAIAVARSKFTHSVTGLTIFPNGLVGITTTGNDTYGWKGKSYPFLKLDAGKVPTSVAMTINHEFGLVTVWDTINHKGQLAVIAIEGDLISDGSPTDGTGYPFFWSVPNWPEVTEIKLLGYVDLPFAAPTSVQASSDLSIDYGRAGEYNKNPDFNSQAERDQWYNWTGGYYRRTAKAGYAIVASRAENKVAFVNLQPLFQYVRTMMFTSQSNYEVVKNSGMADNQWPHSFSHAPQQKPVVAAVISVNAPTAVAAGFAKGPDMFFWDDNGWDDETFTNTAFVATMDGNLRLYDVGNLNTYSTGTKSTPSLTRTVLIGKNPCSIAYGTQGNSVANDLTITCRGDRAIYEVHSDGSVSKILRDSRLVDPVSTEVSTGWRWCGGMMYVSVMDFGGKQAVNYVTRRLSGFAVQDPGFQFTEATPVPGMPFMFSVTEVM